MTKQKCAIRAKGVWALLQTDPDCTSRTTLALKPPEFWQNASAL
ncbi:hypothetical protein [Leptothermofonsia sp. ETS-13]